MPFFLLARPVVSETNCDGDFKRQMRKYYGNTNTLLRKIITVLRM